MFFSKLWFTRLESKFTRAAPYSVICRASPTPLSFSCLGNLFRSGLSEKLESLLFVKIAERLH